MKRAPALRKGDVVRVIAPAGPFEPEAFARGLAVLSRRGYVPRHGRGLFARARYLAGSDDRRVAEWDEAVRDPDARAIIAARGGFGTMRILDRLELAPLLRAPKIVIGFSDLTALHGLLARRGLVSVHGPVVTQLGRVTRPALSAFFRLLESPAPPPPMKRLVRISPGCADGHLFGGNLTLLAHLAGTRYLPSLRGAVLLVEDVRETPYRLDRCFQSLRLSGALAGLAAAVIGHLTECDDQRVKGREVLAECFASLGVPVVAGVPVGHEAENHAFPHGARVRVDADARTLTFLEGAVR